MQNLGYACINMSLSVGPKKGRVTTNRSMIRRTFDKRGSDYASELALQNLNDLNTILNWNNDNDITFFRMSSSIFPWASEYSISKLHSYSNILKSAEKAGETASNYGMRLTSHPGPFNKLCSPKESVVENTIRDLEIHGELFDMLGFSRTPYNKINIHVGAAYDSKEIALDTFCRNFERLSDSVKSRLTVENDDRKSLYSTHELYEGVYKRLGIPIVFDYHHHKFRNDGESEEEALRLAASTWGDVTPVVHYSESMSEEKGDPTIKANAHSDYIYNHIDDYGLDIDIMIEAKAKELALLKYRSENA
jgi:UV DNA damage endonuclease